MLGGAKLLVAQLDGTANEVAGVNAGVNSLAEGYPTLLFFDPSKARRHARDGLEVYRGGYSKIEMLAWLEDRLGAISRSRTENTQLHDDL